MSTERDIRDAIKAAYVALSPTLPSAPTITTYSYESTVYTLPAVVVYVGGATGIPTIHRNWYEVTRQFAAHVYVASVPLDDNYSAIETAKELALDYIQPIEFYFNIKDKNTLNKTDKVIASRIIADTGDTPLVERRQDSKSFIGVRFLHQVVYRITRQNN